MTSWHITIHADARAFLAAAGAMLYARETVNNLILGVCERLANDPMAYEDPFFATVSDDDDKICLAAVMTPPHNLILAGEVLPDAGFTILIDLLKTYRIPIPGVIAPAEMAEQFTQTWRNQDGDPCEESMHMRVYELRHVQMPDLAQGMFKMAGSTEIPTIAQWMQAFELEALVKIHDLDMPRAEKLVSMGNVFIWVVGDEPVSMALKTRPIAHSITVSGVYTPPEHRRQGYAGALVARLSQHLLDEGYQFINLFTDLDNPTSNKIYQAVGYHPVCDFLAYRFNTASRQSAH